MRIDDPANQNFAFDSAQDDLERATTVMWNIMMETPHRKLKKDRRSLFDMTLANFIIQDKKNDPTNKQK